MGLVRKIFMGRGEADEFWPSLIERCTREWRGQLDEAEINRILRNFDPESFYQ